MSEVSPPRIVARRGGDPPLARSKPLVTQDVEALWDPCERLWQIAIASSRWRLTSQSCQTLDGLRLGSLWGEDTGRSVLRVHAVWLPSGPGSGLHLVTELPTDSPRLSTLLPDVPAALYFEREISEMFGIEFVSSPDPRPLLLHMSHDFPPLRKRTAPSRPSGERKTYEFPPVEGEGVYEVPVGPVHAGIIEPGHFRFQVVGEEILSLEVRLGYTHKGTEKLFEGRTPVSSVPLAESVSGDTPIAGAFAYSTAVESALDLQVDAATQAARGLLLEIERVAFLLGDIAGIALDVGYAAGAARANALRQIAYDALEAATGARTGRGVLTIGGLLRPLDRSLGPLLTPRMGTIGKGTTSLLEHLLTHPSVFDRIHGTGTVPLNVAMALQLVGPVARASGLDRDVRSDMPYGPYVGRVVHVPHEQSADVEARLRVKAAEVIEGCRLVLEFLADGATEAPAAPPLVSGGLDERHGLGLVESPRGEYLTWVSIAPDGRLARVHVREPSFLNWPAIEYAVKGNIVPDFPLCNKSLNLSYSGFDR